MKRKLQIVKEENNEFHLRVTSKNGKILIWSESYKRKGGVKKLIALLAKFDFLQEPEIVDESIQIKKSKKQK